MTKEEKRKKQQDFFMKRHIIATKIANGASPKAEVEKAMEEFFLRDPKLKNFY